MGSGVGLEARETFPDLSRLFSGFEDLEGGQDGSQNLSFFACICLASFAESIAPFFSRVCGVKNLLEKVPMVEKSGSKLCRPCMPVSRTRNGLACESHQPPPEDAEVSPDSDGLNPWPPDMPFSLSSV